MLKFSSGLNLAKRGTMECCNCSRRWQMARCSQGCDDIHRAKQAGWRRANSKRSWTCDVCITTWDAWYIEAMQADRRWMTNHLCDNCLAMEPAWSIRVSPPPAESTVEIQEVEEHDPPPSVDVTEGAAEAIGPQGVQELVSDPDNVDHEEEEEEEEEAAPDPGDAIGSSTNSSADGTDGTGTSDSWNKIGQTLGCLANGE